MVRQSSLCVPVSRLNFLSMSALNDLKWTLKAFNNKTFTVSVRSSTPLTLPNFVLALLVPLKRCSFIANASVQGLTAGTNRLSLRQHCSSFLFIEGKQESLANAKVSATALVYMTQLTISAPLRIAQAVAAVLTYQRNLYIVEKVLSVRNNSLADNASLSSFV